MINFFRDYGEKIYIYTFLSASAFFIYGIILMTNEGNFFFMKLGTLLFWCAGNIKLSYNSLFGIGFWKKFSIFLLVMFNIVCLGWALELLTDLKIMTFIMGIA